jgi:hypothetical protein
MKEVTLGDSTTVSELADVVDVRATVIVKLAFTQLGLLATIDESLSFEQAGTIAAELGCTVRRKNDPERR